MLWALDANASVPVWLTRPEDPRALLAFSTRRGGVSDPPYDSLNVGRSTEDRPQSVVENRRLLLTRLGLDPDRVATAGQVHGNTVREARAPRLHPECDALLSRLPGLAVAVTTADCLPVLFVAPGVVAAAHAGWRGTAAGIAAATLAAILAETGCNPEEVDVHLGPSIRACCYRVGPEVAAQFPPRSVRRVDDAWHLDLTAAVRHQLVEAGLPPHRITEVPDCTACDPARYFSHRRDHGRTGRHWAIVALRDA